jgi:hypothetical protein
MVAVRVVCVTKYEEGKPIYQYSDEEYGLLVKGVLVARSLQFKNASLTPNEVGNFNYGETKHIESAVAVYFKEYIKKSVGFDGRRLGRQRLSQ